MSKNRKNIIVLFIVLLLGSISIVEAKVYLVAVGISDYPGKRSDLNLPAKDAKAITELYKKNTELQYCQLLNSEATTDKIKAAMNKVFASAGENDKVVFFFSGHGYKGGFKTYDGRLDYSDIQKAMSRSKCKNKMIFADACFAGKMRGKRQTNSQNIQNTRKNINVMLFLSSRDNEVSIEHRNMKNGFFTTYLINALRGNADTNRDRIITAKELFKFVSENVANISDNKQHPVMWGNFPDNMTVISW